MKPLLSFPDISTSFLRFASGMHGILKTENCTFYPWIKLSSLSSSDFGIIILPDYLPEEEKEARKEILRLKRMLKKTFPDILVTSNLRLSAKTLNEMEKKKKKRKINKE